MADRDPGSACRIPSEGGTEMNRREARDRVYAITEEMAARAQDPRCPRPLALVVTEWANLINQGLRDALDVELREGWEQAANALVCSECGDSFEGDPENMGSDCCSCDLVPAHTLPSIIQQLRKEIERLEEIEGRNDEAILPLAKLRARLSETLGTDKPLRAERDLTDDAIAALKGIEREPTVV